MGRTQQKISKAKHGGRVSLSQNLRKAARARKRRRQILRIAKNTICACIIFLLCAQSISITFDFARAEGGNNQVIANNSQTGSQSLQQSSEESSGALLQNSVENESTQTASTQDAPYNSLFTNKSPAATETSLETPYQASATDAATPSVGSVIFVPSDEGMDVAYTVTAKGTVSLGGSTQDVPSTINYEYTGPLTIPDSIRYKGVSYKVTEIASNAFAPYWDSVTKYTCQISEVNIPASVTTIGANAFLECSKLAKVNFNEESLLTSIGSSAFSSIAISSITIPANVTSLGSGAFSKSPLSQITFLGQGVTSFSDYLFSYTSFTNLDFVPSWVESFGNYCFMGASLRSVQVPSTIKQLGAGVFRACGMLSKAEFSALGPITEIPAETFMSCSSMTTYNFQSFINSVESNAFAASGLETLNVPSNIAYIGEGAFTECESLTSVNFDAGNELMAIQKNCFAQCPELSSVNLPSTVRTISAGAFQNCTALKTFLAPSSLRTIESLAFAYCTALETFVFTGNATYLKQDQSAFYRSNALANIVFYGKKSESLTFVSSIPTYYYTLSYYSSKEDAQAAATPTSRFIVKANAIPATASATDVYSGAYLPTTATGGAWGYETSFSPSNEITNSFYAYATDLTQNLEAGDTFTAKTFEGLDVTYTIELLPTTSATGEAGTGKVKVGYTPGLQIKTAIDQNSTGVVSIPEKVIAPDGNTYEVDAIESYAFFGCSRIRTVSVPSTVKSIGSRAFARATSLTNVYFQADASTITDDAIFAGCSNIKRVVFGGKKANVSFGTSNPDIYYTVVYYASKHDAQIDNRQSTLVVHERALLDSLSEADVYSGSIPELKTGYEWAYEDGFGGDIALTDSTTVYAQGMGLQYDINVSGGNVETTACWFRVLTSPSKDETTGTTTPGTVEVGLGKEGITAIHQSVSGNPIIPSVIYDENAAQYNVVGVGDYAFGSAESEYTACSYITQVTFPSSITYLGKSVFENCTDLEIVIIPAAVTQLGACTFANCPSLTTANFSSCAGLLNLPEYTCYNCRNLSNVTLPANLQVLGNYAFAGCYRYEYNTNGGVSEFGLKNINLPSSLEVIGSNAFLSDALIEKITLPANIKSVGEAAYKNCGRVEEIRFLGNAQGVSFGNEAFHFGSGTITSEGAKLQNLVFMNKKSSTVKDYISAYNTRGDRIDYNTYYNISFYASTQAFNAGQLWSNLLIKEDVALKYYTDGFLEGSVPRLMSYQAWNTEDGFGSDIRTQDSYYAICGNDISQATVSVNPSSYNYTGEYFCPLPTVTWIDGRTLTYGTDYIFDTSVGVNKDGYMNNRYGPVGYVKLKGIGDFAGSVIGTFDISTEVDVQNSFNVKFAEDTTYTYDSTAKTPAISVEANLMGSPYNAREGQDYEVEYSNNVNAGTASVVVRGIGIFAGEFISTFTIEPADIRDCSTTCTATVLIPAGTDVSKSDNILDFVETVDDILSLNFTVTSNFGESLVEDTDFYTVETRSSNSITVDIYGKGNYTNVMSKRVTINDKNDESGSGSGTGGGTGTGSGTGDGSGTGGGTSSGIGAQGAGGSAGQGGTGVANQGIGSSVAANNTTGASLRTNNNSNAQTNAAQTSLTLESNDQPNSAQTSAQVTSSGAASDEPAGNQVAPGGGGGSEGTKRHVFEIPDPQTSESGEQIAQNASNTLLVVLVLATASMAFGALRRKHTFKKDMER